MNEETITQTSDNINIIRGRDFTEEEIMEINRYILTNVPYTVLETVFVLTEKVVDKCSIFITVYRLINSAKSYVGKSETKEKLDKLLNGCIEIKTEVHKYLLRYEEGRFGSGVCYDMLCNILENEKKSEQINNLIDIFLIFAEKQKLYDINKIVGIKAQEVEGSAIVDELVDTDG